MVRKRVSIRFHYPDAIASHGKLTSKSEGESYWDADCWDVTVVGCTSSQCSCNHHIQAFEVLERHWQNDRPTTRPIEHIWDILDRRVRRRDPQPTTVKQLTRALVEEWDRITQPEIQRFINSMHRRIQAVCDTRGGHTRY